ncbi:type I-F CRISPR-associated protein Csy2 [Erwinia psidii]|uniref:Type I-F CRISPR-associated protein Csy2 n=1 Tax=Erwinia psidii TaxID=69224 RepID=A0A3N6UR24_9GAMM|nr:type I-F CRISPR-associated protein Csy2 [Erwinia psidii]MCX8957823.1 type I-F CRISPR-associated protein Csy2 [Erwinia psidii]MCX8960873.1 type I-F CRISPR-associated protein Csy2 [Erwinia psidii]MCX8964887.1 type I-F CRISPR-associated protein Csy2 [Erwinia psidii]RQM38439.1 type I-F CRISPR-associated protein Csy2 [Erwinia psidii]
MSSLILLRHLRVENANTVAGLTWGFPAITHFLGYTHALSRRLQQSHGLTLDKCAVICHQQQHHAHASGGRDAVFSLTRNPLTREAKTAAFNEEGRMHMTVSLLIECQGAIANGREGAKALEAHLQTLCVRQRLAGGTVISMAEARVIGYPHEQKSLRRVLYRLLPGFALLDRSACLSEHYQTLKQQNPQAEMIDAWLDFAVVKMSALAVDGDASTSTKTPAEWRYVAKPQPGYLVPIQTGWQSVSPLFPAGEVEKSRDPATPFRFVEAIYGIGEWRSLHRITDLNTLLWCHDYQDGLYRCCSVLSAPTDTYEFIDEE